MVRRMLVPGLAVMAGLALLSGCSSDEKDVAHDVSVSSCQAGAGGGRPKAEGTIINDSSKESGYAFRVEFRDPAGNKVSDGAVTVAQVKPGATANWQAEGATSANGPLTCKVDNVVRTAVP